VELSAHGSGVHGRVRCDVVERPVVLCRRACVVAVGGNGRVQMASDMWLTPEHRTLRIERPVAPYERPVPTCLVKGQRLV